MIRRNSMRILSPVQRREFNELVKEIESKNFTYSSEVSHYITSNHLGSRYPNISGISTFKRGCDTWTMEGGFPRDIYAMLCQRLHLSGKNTSAVAVAFTPYSMMK